MKFKKGQRFLVLNVNGDRHLQLRLMEMGFCPHQELIFLQQAPFGGAIMVELGSTVIALRTEEFECLQLKLIA